MSSTDNDSAAEAWDEFLASSARGQFQQRSGWAQVKALEGWSSVREYLGPAGPRSGGFQLLWKQSGLARIGYVSKGPVLPEETEAAVDAAIEKLTALARRLRLSAVLVQPPDDSRISSAVLVRHSYFPQPVASVARATGTVSLEGGADGVIGRMSRTARQDWRSAGRQGVTLRWGTRDDLAHFFGLMRESCRRQHTNPNPSHVELLEALWSAFPDGLRLAFAEHSGRTQSGLLMIRQGSTIIFWKKGWVSEQPRLFANQFLMTECLVWAAAEGYVSADMLAMSPEIATSILSNAVLTEAQRHGRDVFNLRLGARPKLLPPAHLFVTSRLLRGVVYSGLRWRRLRRAIEQRVG